MTDYFVIYNVKTAYENRINLKFIASPHQARQSCCVEAMYLDSQLRNENRTPELEEKIKTLLYHPNHQGGWVSGN